MCHKGQQIAAGTDFLRDDLYEIARRQIRPVFPYLRKAMLFGDGEPMVYPHFWEIVEEIRSASPQCMIDFINNGSMMHEANRKRLFDYKISHLGLSIGGATAQSHNFARPPGLFDKIVDNYRNLYEEKKTRNTFEPYVSAYIVVMQCNYKELPDLVRLCDQIGIFQLSLQKLFVTHVMVQDQVVSDAELEPYVAEASKVAKELSVGFDHYPMSEKTYKQPPVKANFNDLMFSANLTLHRNGGYCEFQQPWNTVYVLHDGKVVPDCHWWTSIREMEFNDCGTLNETENILDIWYGKKYDQIRRRILIGDILPQCRGCGLAGGVVPSFRSAATDHTNPNYEKRLVQITVPSKSNSKKELVQKIVNLSYDNEELVNMLIDVAGNDLPEPEDL